MADTPAAFRQKTDQMFSGIDDYLDRVGQRFIEFVAADLIDTTPGPNLQLYDTEYIATGRLRAGWTWDVTARNVASRWEGGPYTEHGDDTLADITSALKAAKPLPAISYLQNDVAYGFIVHEGIGRMPEARPWRTAVVLRMDQHAAAAIEEARRG